MSIEQSLVQFADVKYGSVSYNTAMRGKSDVLRLVRIACVLWLAYLVVSAAIDYGLKSPGDIENFLYIANGGIALFLFGLTFWPSLSQKIGKVFLLLMVFLICALPIIANQIAIRYIFRAPFPPPEAMLTRILPFLLIALLLVAWQYRWRQILIFSVIIALINVGIVWFYGPHNRSAFSDGLFAVVTQVFTFLVVGLFINFIVVWLRGQTRELEEANSRLTNYAQTLEDLAITKERSRLAQELHDTLSHTLSGLSVQLETMKAYWDIDSATARERLDKSLVAVRDGLEETRRILMALRAKPLEEKGLLLAIRQMAEEAAVQASIDLDFTAAENIPPLSPRVEQCIYRVAQEAITNVIKHAKAKKMTVKMEINDNKVVLKIQDDGIGFDTHKGNGTKRFGLLGMKERAEFVNGEISINSQHGIGTIVQLTV